MSKLAVHGEALSVEIACHVLAPAGLTSNETLTASGPAVVAVSPTVPARFAPGLLNVTVGAVESTCTVNGVVVRTLPALSVTRMRRS